ncbi:hypothetical protein M409DRAFT_26995 [Zasmidium cellare ATCC 36951]|uniref:Uncharacterized protein n=1 Tax=Zasmidium cellare ATCC 36951 TaxID=1080233 RepID=A0A6A6C6F1_ZASCE|nr:uncharacterized protein M409DRAFT_26995 [Zasmidium cellare ATCC 36951]KAF2162757.1 hypothetical protein M409DRAFT_26995 [Zasmidium cellare ATCC 36951]
MENQIQTQPQIHESRKSFGTKVGECFRRMFSCCAVRDEEEGEGPRKALVISSPTNFRREEINIPGLNPEQERFVREKALRDAEQLYARLQPLNSSPSGNFAERPPSAYNHAPNFPTFEQFTQPRSGPSPHSSKIDRVMAHGRKLSDNFKNSLGPGGGGGGYHAVGSRQGSDSVEMRALMDPSQTAVGGSPRPGIGGTSKMSEDSLSRTTVTEESTGDLDAKKGGDTKL